MVMVAESQPGDLDGSSLQSLQFPTMIVTENTVKKKLKIKITSKKVEVELGMNSHDFGGQSCMSDEFTHNISVNREKRSDICRSHKFAPFSSENPKLNASDRLKVKLPVSNCSKRKASGMTDVQKEKRRRMDRSVRQQCTSILKALMTHKSGWVFNNPVDPVTLNIPDYFSIISEPMDLGTIKTKLENTMYFDAEEFAAHVRLTFSNAMLYNPPSNKVHHMAKDLDNIFNRRWKLLEEQWNREDKTNEHTCTSIGGAKNLQDGREACSKKSHFPLNLSSKEKKSLKKERKEVDPRAEKAKRTKDSHNGTHLLSGKSAHKGIDDGNRSACSSAATAKCVSCSSETCQCSCQSDNFRVSSSDSCSAKSLRQNHYTTSKAVSESTLNKSEPDSDCSASALDEENTCLSPNNFIPATIAPSVEGWTALTDLRLSPKKALRAAILKSRFADTILKAKQKTLLDHGDKADLEKRQLEKEKLERQQHEEKVRIEAQIRAAEAASRKRAEAELKFQRERQREAARMALQKMEKTVEFDNLEILKDLELLSGSSPSDCILYGSDMAAAMGHHFGNPLQRLGLFIKDDYVEDEDEEAIWNADGEDGEIFS